MKRRWKLLITVGVLLLVVVLAAIIHHYQLRAAVEAYKAQLKSRGVPMELSEILPPAVPPEQNGADLLRQASVYLDNTDSFFATRSYSAMKMVAPGKAMVCFRQPDARGFDTTNSWDEVSGALAQDTNLLSTLEEMIARPDLDFHINYDTGVDQLVFTNLHLPQAKKAIQRLSVATLCDLHRGDTASAARRISAMLALTQVMRDERLEISELVRMAMGNITFTANWELLQSPGLTDEQLAPLQDQWLNLNFLESSEHALAMERILGGITANKYRSSSKELQHSLEFFNSPPKSPSIFHHLKVSIRIFMWKYWWSYTDELQSLKGYDVLNETAHIVATNGSFHIALQKEAAGLVRLHVGKMDDDMQIILSSMNDDLRTLLSSSISTFSFSLRKTVTAETASRVMATAIALKRYQLRHGNYPGTLDALVPEFLPRVLLDPENAQPSHYQPINAETFLLYSVGQDGVDDGGHPAMSNGKPSSLFWQNPNAPDWVWPQPATADEIQKFYQEQAKNSD